MDCSPPGSSVHGISPGKNTGVGCHALLQGTLAENIYSKVFGVAALFFLLRQMFWTWEEIGFDFDELGDGINKGLKLAVLSFTFAYCFEMLYLSAKGGMPRFKIYPGSFSLNGESVQSAGLKAFALCVIFNIR